MVKKIIKIFGIVVVIIVIALISIPLLFGGTIKEKVKNLINEQVNAQVDFKDVDVSLFRSFPEASVLIDGLSVITYAPFEGDTLAYAEQIALDMSIKELFKGADEPIAIDKFIVDEAVIKIVTDSLGNQNFDIAKETTANTSEPEKPSDEESGSFTFSLNHYEINHSNIFYQDQTTAIRLLLTDINHTGDGTLSGEKVILDTKSDTEISFELDSVNYLNKNKLKLDAILELDLANQHYAFKENKATINQLPLTFEGYTQLFENYTEVDLSFKTPDSDFKNFLAVIPEAYSKNLDGVETSGNFSIDGVIKGKVDETTIPTLDIKMKSDNASFKYPDLPKSVRNINLDAKILNESGLVDDTSIVIDTLNFTIDQDRFAARGNFKNLTKNILVDLGVNGTLNLASLDQAYPLDLEQKLSGILKANIRTQFDMNSLEKEQYQNVKSYGSASIANFTYASPELPNELQMQIANVSFKPEMITLEELNATTGKSDVKAKGNIQNLMGFLFAKQDLKGNFEVSSNVFAVNDFMVPENDKKEDGEADQSENTKESNTSNTEALKIPSFLDATLAFNANKVIYDNLELKNAKGTVTIKDETAYLKNVSSDIFDGKIALNGNVSTKETQPTFGMDLDLSKIDITQSFQDLELLRSLAPIAKALTGALSTQLTLNGNLSDELTPVLTSLKGNALAEILNAQVSTAQTPLLSKLDGQLNFVDLDKLNLDDIKTSLTFDDGKINVKPFDFTVKGIKVTAGGSHGFDMNMDYNVTLDVPAKYLGSEVGGLLSQLSQSEVDNMNVPIPIGLNGTFNAPKIDLNTSTAIKQLTNQIVSSQKNKAKEEIKDKGKQVLTDLLGGGKEQAKDSTDTKTQNTEDKIKDAAKDVLGGLFGKKKKKDSTNN